MIGLKKRKQMTEQVQEEKETYSAGKLQFKKELPDLDNIMPQAKIIRNPNKDDFMNFKVVYTPESDSYWYGGKYEFSFSVPDSYPFMILLSVNCMYAYDLFYFLQPWKWLLLTIQYYAKVF